MAIAEDMSVRRVLYSVIASQPRNYVVMEAIIVIRILIIFSSLMIMIIILIVIITVIIIIIISSSSILIVISSSRTACYAPSAASKGLKAWGLDPSVLHVSFG